MNSDKVVSNYKKLLLCVDSEFIHHSFIIDFLPINDMINSDR